MASAAPARDRTIAYGPYLLREELGRGGMAVVYRAESRKPESFGRDVALKVLCTDNEFDVDFDFVRMFVDEARLATRFRHPNIARTYSLGKIDGTYFLEMEYVRGPTLFQLAKQAAIAGAIPLEIIGHLLIQVCDALAHVHAMCDDRGAPLGLVHRDVSLSNIIVADDGVVKLIDFGVVKGHSCARTAAGMIKGKVAYIAPEYLAGALDRRADLFALGVVAFELLTGRRLFQGKDDLDTLTRIRKARVPPPSRLRPDVPPELDAIVARALARDPDHRWQTAGELRDALVALYGEPAPQQIRDWIAWAFRCERPRVAALSELIESLDQPTSVAVDLNVQLVASESVARPVLPLVLAMAFALFAAVMMICYAAS